MHKRLMSTLTVGMAICLALMGLMASGATASNIDTMLDPTPYPDDYLLMLAHQVETDNQQNGNSTTWRGGPLGVLDAMPTVGYGDKLAGFALEDVSGTTIIDRIEGPKLLNFWATWCGPCMDEIPDLIEAALDPDTSFEVIFVNVWDTPEDLGKFISKQPEGLHILRNGDSVADDLGVMAIPTSILIDADGIVRIVHVGNITPTVMEFFQAVASESELE